MLEAFEGHAREVELLIAAGAGLDVTDMTGQTPIKRPARDGRTHVLELLIAAGADVSAPYFDGETARAAYQGKAEDNARAGGRLAEFAEARARLSDTSCMYRRGLY
jgi:hypothetical protein